MEIGITDGVGEEDEFDKIPSLTFIEITTRLAEHETEKQKLLWETRKTGTKINDDEIILNFGIKSKTRKQIYKALIERTNAREEKFHVHYADIVEGKPFEWILANSGRIVDVKYANKYYNQMSDIDPRGNMHALDHQSITIKNPGYDPHSISNRNPYWNDMETEQGSPEFQARLAQATKASLNDQHYAGNNIFPEDRREGNPGPQSSLHHRKNVRFSEETSVVNNPNNPNPDYYSSDMTFDERMQAAIALSNQVAGAAGGAVAAAAPVIIPTTRNLEKLEFDLAIEEVAEVAPRITLPLTREDAKSNPDYNVDVGMENREEWLARLKRSNVISEADHMKADIVIQ